MKSKSNKIKLLYLLGSILILPVAYSQNPSIKVIDTDFSKGRLTHQQTITLQDAEKLHGHLCDGLVVGFLGLKEGLYSLYPDSIIDRTNTRIVSKSSPCLTDIAVFLTGGRYQFNTFYVNDSLPYMFVVQRIDNGKAVGIKLKPGIKPSRIDEMGNKAVHQLLSSCELDELKQLEQNFSNQLLSTPPTSAFTIVPIPNFEWQPQPNHHFIKTDIINKAVPTCNKN
jgi:acetolactate decarboxylase